MDKKIVLYIEDSGIDRELVRRLLEAEGFRVLVTGVPDEGMELARSELPDLILIDLHLPGMDGNWIAEYIRKIPQLRLVPIIALSASIKEEEKEKLLAPFDGFLKKPVDVDAFPREVLELISRGRSYRKDSRAEQDKGDKEAITLSEETREVLEALEKVRAAMSHDLRTPLTVMISYANTVSREKVGALSEKQKEMLDTVVDHGFQMDALISELVHIARETLDRFDYPPK
jgi:two-component system cell cycle response regulator DivK